MDLLADRPSIIHKRICNPIKILPRYSLSVNKYKDVPVGILPCIATGTGSKQDRLSSLRKGLYGGLPQSLYDVIDTHLDKDTNILQETKVRVADQTGTASGVRAHVDIQLREREVDAVFGKFLVDAFVEPVLHLLVVLGEEPHAELDLDRAVL